MLSGHANKSVFDINEVKAGTLFLYGLLRIITANPVPIPTTTRIPMSWGWDFLENGGTNLTNATRTNATQGTVHNPPIVYNPPARRRRTILPYDDPHAPRRNDSDPCLRQFDGVQLTHINGTKRMYSIPLHTLFTATIWKRPGSRWEHDNKYVCDGPIGGKPEWRKGTSWGCSLTGCRNAGHILWDTRVKRAGIGIAGTGNRATRAFTNPRARSDGTRLLQEGGGLSMEGKNMILTLTSFRPHPKLSLLHRRHRHSTGRSKRVQISRPDQGRIREHTAPISSPYYAKQKVDHINYIHYNVQRLANLTRDALEGISTQLAATSLMAFQNRVALDMLLAEKGGVCAMFGDQCCTFIPNNTAPDGSVTKALNGLRALSTELKEASGLDNPLEAWMQGLFGRWKALVMAVLTSLACFLAILITCG
ncbi:Endogenous retrovirus group V member 2 Env polyprotein [Merluccius polli]|uniref:Endogenous retrovirus group V member 2 Env polyprotein n=1 Tax=Merluccius polli TaxID=89951 RepID=A0AA47MFT2_MERPO|nr:Endogenous retrovirus group V member 2 Env polyprotein [Merluccius polli]